MSSLNPLRGLSRAALSATLACCAAAPAAAVTVFADNFNSYSYGLGLTTVGVWKTASSPVGIPVSGSGGGVDVIGTGSPYDFYPGNGNYIDLDGTVPGGPTFFYTDVSLATVVATYGGYTGAWTASLTFDVGQNPGGSAGRQVAVFIAGNGVGQSVFSTSALTSHTRTLTFSDTLAANSVFRIGFYTPSADGQGPILDNVRFSVSPVPEAEGLVLALAGLGTAALFARRRKRV